MIKPTHTMLLHHPSLLFLLLSIFIIILFSSSVDAVGYCKPVCLYTCNTFGYECGSHTICDEKVNCGTCPSDQTCDSQGLCQNVAASKESPPSTCSDTCDTVGYDCGIHTICNEKVSCGSCPLDETCASGHCVCTETCTSLGYDCGTHTICGEQTDCGTCPSGQICTAGHCVACTDTCASIGYDCGTHIICGEQTDCGTCALGRTCTAGHCVCTDTCTSLGYDCGTQTICGASTNCGTCPSGQTCDSQGLCQNVAASEEESPPKCTDSCTSLGYDCGTHTICEEQTDCGTCAPGKTCTEGVCMAPNPCEIVNKNGDGSINIQTCEQLQCIGNDPNFPLNGHYLVTEDVDCTATNPSSSSNTGSMWDQKTANDATHFGYDGTGFKPIGNLSSPFTGIFDGQNHEVSNLYIDRSSQDYVGLFGYTTKTTIKNVGIAEYIIKASSHAGALVGQGNEGTIISNCYSSCNEQDSFWDCYVEDTSNSGGLIGSLDQGSLCKSYTRSPHIKAMNWAGGLAASVTDSSVNNCYSINGAVESDNQIGGGLIGILDGSSVNNCYSNCDVSIGHGHGGGLIGEMDGSEVRYSYSTSQVSTPLNNAAFLGGLVGSTDSASSIISSYATGPVEGPTSYKAAFVGYNKGSILDSYATHNSGGSCGICNTYGKCDGLKCTEDGVSTLTSDEMKVKSSYIGWDFSSVWDITSSTNNGYPTLRISPGSCECNSGFYDCNNDGNCECDLNLGYCSNNVCIEDLVYENHTSVDCIALGGTVVHGTTDDDNNGLPDAFCKFGSTSIPLGWTQFRNWRQTIGHDCPATCNPLDNCRIASCYFSMFASINSLGAHTSGGGGYSCYTNNRIDWKRIYGGKVSGSWSDSATYESAFYSGGGGRVGPFAPFNFNCNDLKCKQVECYSYLRGYGIY